MYICTYVCVCTYALEESNILYTYASTYLFFVFAYMYVCMFVCMQVFSFCIQIKELAAMLLKFKSKHSKVQPALDIFYKYAGKVPPGKKKMIPANIKNMTHQLLVDVGSF